MEYREYLLSPEWKNKRKEALKFHSRCAVCWEKKVDIHHKTYRNVGAENCARDLIPLCREHHYSVHEFAKSERLNLYNATKKYIRKNNSRPLPPLPRQGRRQDISMKKPTIFVKKTDKWIILTYKGNQAKFRRSSNRGILLESMLNQPTGTSVPTEHLTAALNSKTPLPPNYSTPPSEGEGK